MELDVRGHVIDFGKPWRRASMSDLVKEKTGIDFRLIQSVEEANQKLAGLNIHEPQPSVGEALVKAFKSLSKKI